VIHCKTRFIRRYRILWCVCARTRALDPRKGLRIITIIQCYQIVYILYILYIYIGLSRCQLMRACDLHSGSNCLRKSGRRRIFFFKKARWAGTRLRRAGNLGFNCLFCDSLIARVVMCVCVCVCVLKRASARACSFLTVCAD